MNLTAWNIKKWPSFFFGARLHDYIPPGCFYIRRSCSADFGTPAGDNVRRMFFFYFLFLCKKHTINVKRVTVKYGWNVGAQNSLAFIYINIFRFNLFNTYFWLGEIGNKISRLLQNSGITRKLVLARENLFFSLKTLTGSKPTADFTDSLSF